jgi:hypothetical protein
MTTGDSEVELFSEEVGEEKKKGRSETRSAENENAGRNGICKEVKVKNTRLTDKEKLEILNELHETPIGGHIGMKHSAQRHPA